MNLAELRARLDAINTERREIHTEAGAADLTADQQTRWDALDTEETQVREQITQAEENDAETRAARVAESRARWGATQVRTGRDPFDPGNGARASRQALVESVIRANEHRGIDAENERHFEALLHRYSKKVGGRAWAQQLLARSRPEYESGFCKVMLGRSELLDDAERRALSAVMLSQDDAEERTAISVGSNTNGGYLLPTHLDPTLILTNNGASNEIRQVAKVVELKQGYTAWHGVTTAGVTASWDGELVEVSDDTPTVGSVTIPTNFAQALVQASIAAFEDISNLEQDVMMLFADARDRLEAAAFATGSGSGQPKGIFTACAASSGVQVVSTTAATIGEVDIHAVYRALPKRFRRRGKWLTNPLYASAVKRLGTAVSSSYSGDLRDPLATVWLNHEVIESDDAPSTQTTTAKDDEIVFGDFQNYVVVDKPGGMSVEFIPHLFNTANNLPDGRRGYYAYWRTGGDVANLNAFRELVDKTSA
ncbi:phage major capsid protein [Actinoplanes oblitus]|uniref:Phage major capsid protein n=1 Tax=Actinoplanes oblitus TaxID=3040509 RepID=A0ABY8WPL1_9ACTN|nr:phage major capsid protein [Actinoplanes oblitus]WIM97695.1 phage major capsid protein [Actinoplanes oblitus]